MDIAFDKLFFTKKSKNDILNTGRRGLMQKKRLWLCFAMAVALTGAFLTAWLWPKTKAANHVGICYREGSNQEHSDYRRQIENELKALGYTLTVTDGDNDQAKQLMKIEELAQQGCDLLLIEPVMTDGAKELLTAVDQTGLPAVLFNRQLDTSLIKAHPRVAYIGYDDSNLVRQQVGMLKGMTDGGDINGDGIVCCMLLMGPSDLTLSKQYDNYFSADPGFQVLLAKNGEGTLESGRKHCKDGLAAYGKDIEVILCANHQIASGAREAIVSGGRTVGKDVYLLSIGGQSDDLTMVENGEVSGIVYRGRNAQIQAVVETVHAYLQAQLVDPITILPNTPVTAKS